MTPETVNHSHSHSEGCSDGEIGKLIERLNSLKEGVRSAADLARCGQRAVEPLRRFLLDGKPSGIFQPRQRAVEALAELGARDVLIEYLTTERQISDPVDRYGEEAVEGTAARLLAEWRDDEVYRILLWLLRRRALPGLIEALGGFRRSEVIPDFITALGDSIGRSFAEEALAKLGEAAQWALMVTARTPLPSADHETPTSLCRRRSALRLLAQLRVSAEEWHTLSPMADDRDPEISARVNRIALAAPDESGRKRAASRLIGMLPNAPWFLQIEIEGWLLEYSDITRGVIEDEIAARRLAADAGGSTDDVLPRLLRLKHKIEAKQ